METVGSSAGGRPASSASTSAFTWAADIWDTVPRKGAAGRRGGTRMHAPAGLPKSALALAPQPT